MRGEVGWAAHAVGAVAWSCRGAGGLSMVWVLVTYTELLVGAAARACPSLVGGAAFMLLSRSIQGLHRLLCATCQVSVAGSFSSSALVLWLCMESKLLLACLGQ